MRDAVKLSVSLMNYPLTIANFGITSTNNAFLINAILPAFTSSKLTIEAQEQGVEYVQS